MSNRIEVLRARMHAEENERKAAKVKAVKAVPVKIKTVKTVKLKVKSESAAPEPFVFDPPVTLMECVAQLSPEEASNPNTVAGTIALHIIDQLMRTPRRCAMLSDNMSENLAWLTAEAFVEKPNLSRVFSTAVALADAIEFRSSSAEGSGIGELHELESLIMKRKLQETV